MLTKEDLQAIAEIMDLKINTAIQTSENRMKAYIESHVEKDIKKIAEGHVLLNERLDHIQNVQLPKIESDIMTIKAKVLAHDFEIARLENAQ
ncbi:MAG: hypothetical protein U0N53_10900 [Ruthenibacterium sp.]|jgi:hypothetical protein|nr:hypothetical protein [Ruthenibacterium sp.]